MTNKKEKKYGTKYQNKPKLQRYFHRYTGIIFLSIFLVVSSILIYDWQVNKVFFEDWKCHQILPMNVTGLDERETKRFDELVKGCGNNMFVASP